MLGVPVRESEEPLLLDLEREGFEPMFRGLKRSRRAWRPGFHPVRRYLGTILVAALFFTLGFAARKPETIREFRVRITPGGGSPSVVSEKALSKYPTKLDPRAMRVRVLNELLQERYPPGHSTGIRRKNFVALDRLSTCLEEGNCHPSEEKIVLLASFRFPGAEGGGTGGEEVWARSSIMAFRELNYTLVMTYGHMDTLMVYQHLPDMIPVVLWEQAQLERCEIRDEENHETLARLDTESPGTWQTGKKACIQTEYYPEGIPWWKSFMFLFWAQHGHPLGGNWVLAPEDYTYIRQNDEEHNYLGYSIEHQCLKFPTYTARKHRALILAKNDHYFDDEHNLFRNSLAEARDRIEAITVDGKKVKFELLSTSGDELQPGETKQTLEPGIVTIGRQPQKDWMDILSQSKVLLGIGRPQLSPSPYDALCLGVPFINPILHWDRNDPDDRIKWETQQDALKYTNAPYVYHVFAGDTDGLVEALQSAVNNPIDRYIPKKMKMENVIERHRKFVETDWHQKAIEWVHEQYGEEAPNWRHLTLDMPALDDRGHIIRE